MAWSDAYMVDPKDYQKEISPNINPNLGNIPGCLITRDCWQATPGRVIDLIRRIGVEKGGRIYEDCQLIDVRKENGKYIVLARIMKRNMLNSIHLILLIL